MSTLELPLQLRGLWEHALIMTYGLDIAFFERTLLPLFSSECRNKIVLVDGAHFLEICAHSARSEEQPLHFNQTYLASGIFASHAAHSKIILLANKKQGRLLVGSGNTSWQGYASGGELFTIYEYRKENSENLSAFLAVRELVEQLVKRRYIQGAVEQRLAHIWSNAPWMWQRKQVEPTPIRHSLNTSFLTQIKQFIGEETVEELWVLAPFFDERAAALAELVHTVRPAHTVLFLQSNYVSVDRLALQQVLDGLPGHYEIRPLQAKDGQVYIHAKLYVLKLSDRALCVQGSPNMSQVAMLLHDPQGNVETANFLVGPRDAFDDLLAELPLAVGPAQTDLSGLELTYQKKAHIEESKKQPWQLLGGDWQHDRLRLHIRGTVPDLSEAHLVINGQGFPLDLWNMSDQMLELTLSGLARELLTRPMPIFIQWNDGAGTSETNPIIPSDITKLDRILQQEEQGSEHLDRSADLNLDDQEFEELLGELHHTLAIDQDSIWKVALRPTSPQKAVPEDKELHLRYDEIDYEALRSHPKIRQYLEHDSGAFGTTQTRIGKILHAIASHMQRLLQQGEVELPSLANAIIPSSEEPEEEPFFEEEPGIKEDEPVRRWSVRSRIHRVLSRFIQRYLRSLASPEFQQLVGYEVVAKNYLIFSHLLWRLFAKDWLKYDEIIEAFIQSWRLFWGDRTMPGYFYQLSIEEQLEIWEWMRYYRNDALMLAAYYFAALIVVKEQKEDLRFSVRDSWRNFLNLSPFPLTPDVLEDTQKLLEYLLPYRSPKATEIANELTQLAYFETQRHVIVTLVADGYLPAGNCSFRKDPVQRKSFGSQVSVDCLAIDSSAALSTKEAAILLLQAWMQVEWRDYYRIVGKEPNDVHEYRYLIFYDMKEQSGKYSVRGEDGKLHAEGIPQIQLPVKSWEAGLKHLRETAQQATRTSNLAAKDKNR